MNCEINKLLDFGLQQGLLQKEDVAYATNLLLDILQIDTFTRVEEMEVLDSCDIVLEKIVNKAIKKGLLENTITARDLFDTRVMNCIMPRPSEVIREFKQHYQESPKHATDYYYQLSIASNYIRKARTDKNIAFTKYYKYGNFDITINLSKPEKDPNEIAKAKLVPSSEYPKCLLCKENVGFSGDLNRPARQTHRIIPLQLDSEKYYLQYSPYVYYNEHCIILNEEHKPMQINETTFLHLLSFLDVFPHYMIGSNADLPIVGGSILSHDHFQGGRYHFAMEDARVIETMKSNKHPNLTIEILEWPLSTIRITGGQKQDLLVFANQILEAWKGYSNPTLDIMAMTNDVPHNTITPIARKKEKQYQLDLVLRNNRTSAQYPDGIFHPHPNLHHIKKENIGLIEVMGLAILPPRLETELQMLEKCLLQEASLSDYSSLEKHKSWFVELTKENVITKDNVTEVLQVGLVKKFVQVLEDAGVFKNTVQGRIAFVEFVASLL